MKKYDFTDEMVDFLVKNQSMNRAELEKAFNCKFKTDYTKDTIRLELYKHTDRRVKNKHNYSNEQEKFIKENNGLSHKEITLTFNRKFGTSISQSALTSKRKNMGLCKYKHHKYTDDEIKWIKNQSKEISKAELFKRFCKEFGRNMTEKSFISFLSKSGIRTEKRHHYTKKQNDFLIENVGKIPYRKLTELFNEKFNADVSLVSLRGQCLSYLGVKQGFNPKNHLEVGEKRKSSTGYTRIKTTKQEGLDRNVRWKALSRMIYEEHYGKIPENCVIVFLDGNKGNLDINNLYCITKSIHAIMASHQWFTDSREHTLTAIKWCELYYAMNDMEGNNANKI